MGTNNFLGSGSVPLNQQFVSVKWFGAQGDGVTDDTTAISDAIAAIGTGGGGSVSAIDLVKVTNAQIYGNVYDAFGSLLTQTDCSGIVSQA